MKYLICVVTYNRLKSLERLIMSLVEAEYSKDNTYDLWISIDHSAVEEDIVEQSERVDWGYGEKKIITYHENMGLKKHMLKCISYVKNYDGIFLFEDDLLVGKDFSSFIDQTVSLNDDLVGGTALYSYTVNEFANFAPFRPYKGIYDVYLMMVPCSWGEFWTKKQALDFLAWIEADKKVSYDKLPYPVRSWGDKSWKILFYWYLIEKRKYIIYPYFACCTNMGEAGVHNVSTSNFMQSYLVETIGKVRVPDKSSELVMYNHYMESVTLDDLFKDTTIDIYGVRRLDELDTRYLLTTKILNCDIKKSWNFGVTPYELSIYKNIQGKGIYLYDLFVKNNHKKSKYNVFLSYIPYNRGLWFGHIMMILKSMRNSIINLLKK